MHPYFEGPILQLPVYLYLSPASMTELLFHPTSFVETERSPSACSDPIKSSPSLPGPLCQSADFSLGKVLESLGGTFQAHPQVQVRLVSYTVTVIWPSFDMIIPHVPTSESSGDVKQLYIHRHLSKICMTGNYNIWIYLILLFPFVVESHWD